VIRKKTTQEAFVDLNKAWRNLTKLIWEYFYDFTISPLLRYRYTYTYNEDIISGSSPWVKERELKPKINLFETNMGENGKIKEIHIKTIFSQQIVHKFKYKGKNEKTNRK
jgi:hypothetical protein